jgi:asparagine synthase (glutamine-hydrolysing)
MIDATLRDADRCAALGLRPGGVARIWQKFLDRPGSIYWTRPWALFALLQWASTNGVSC